MINFQKILLTLFHIKLMRLCLHVLAMFVCKIDEISESESKTRDWMIWVLLLLAIYPREKTLMIGWFKDLTGGRKR